MIFEYHSNIFSTRYTIFVLEIVSQAAFFIWVKTDQGRMRCDVESSEVFHIIDSINIHLGLFSRIYKKYGNALQIGRALP